ncbi:hypothetical protein ACP70R_044734 [Stipagrostis hirtigluma subsp. patula]
MEAAGGTSGGGGSGRGEGKAAACDVEALRRCLEENKGDRAKCQAHIDAFRSSCAIAPNSRPPPPPPPQSS